MEDDSNFANYLLLIKKKKEKKRKLKTKIDKEISRQDKLLKDIEEILRLNNFQTKKDKLNLIHDKEFKKFNKFNQFYQKLLKKFAFISLQHNLIEEMDSDFFKKKKIDKKT